MNWTKLIISLVVCQLAGIIGSIFTSSSIPTWYAAIKKPAFNPPNWIFGPVWITLFVMMGISLYLIWNLGLSTKAAKIAIIIFGIQLVLNTLWSILFFGLQSPFYAFIEIIILWIFILASIISFYPISRTASLLLVPYILWVSFAAVLNFYIWRLNLT
ncbi:tryptophan-rich sensory protein [Candidatus Woesearchaeota archaeon]|nr:tryptophan-rich sensory protein [Candidatus Woesearchaeota archaeon]